MSKEGKWRLLRKLLLLGSILAAAKLIFVDYTLDEEYQVVMAYRRLKGDNLFGTMWEPHQTSAFACVFLMRIYLALTGGTTGIVVFLRLCTTAVQALLSVWLYRTLCRVTEKDYAFLISVCWFNIVPKIIQIPEFSNLQLWSFTIVILSLARYFGAEGLKQKRGGWTWLVLSGVGMALEVLAYPADILLFPFFLLVLLAGSGKARWRNVLLFGGTCAACAAVWLLYVLSRVTAKEFFRNLKYIPEFDLTHDITLGQGEKLSAILSGIGRNLLLFGLAVAVGLCVYGLIRKRAEEAPPQNRFFTPAAVVPVVFAAEGIQLFYWLVLQKGYEEPQIHLFTVCLLAAVVWRFGDDRKKRLLPCLIGGLLILLAVLYMSDLSFFYAAATCAYGDTRLCSGTDFRAGEYARKEPRQRLDHGAVLQPGLCVGVRKGVCAQSRQNRYKHDLGHRGNYTGRARGGDSYQLYAGLCE